MKFTAKRSFRHAGSKFKAKEPYDSELCGLSDAQVEQFYLDGWVDIEGKEPGPDPEPGEHYVLAVHDSMHL
jgi:hypothetical protein